MLALFLPIFLVFLLIGMPVFFAMLAAPGLILFSNDMSRDLALMYRNIYSGIFSFPLLAIPFFMLAGELMNRGGITLRLVEFSQTLIGHVRGGLAQVNILSSMLFAGLSGSAVADTSALGSMLIPAMEKNGYKRRYAAAVTAASSVIGPIIPPSGIMIIYAYVMEVSVAALFAAGIVPGILVGLSLMGIVNFQARKEGFPPASERATWKQTGQASVRAFLPLLTPIIILGGILGGVFTPTEASAVAAFYALVIGLFVLGTLKWRDLPGVFTKASLTSAVVLLLVGAAMAFKTVVSLSHVAENMAEWIVTLTSNPLILLFMINLLLFVVGMFLDAGPAIIILGPILGPIFVSLGVDPVHFAMIMSVNLTVGLITPPMGLVLFVASSVSGDRVETIARSILPFLAVEIVVIFLITYVPAVSLTIPRLLGLVN
ncbi:TRAP transporter large permease [Oricola cellulosilytica]|uniref:TRAP transporter large permease protein n=1 Tax=Oricola cellulosilytica TaxID=1429082 RepID=A0A4R0PIK4_9HYPH|nr:TRAP transporter large permease [Oricola cellulosilytica]TCD16330.1 TRAP transporter large permease [Oricola cellulosilytica]